MTTLYPDQNHDGAVVASLRYHDQVLVAASKATRDPSRQRALELERRRAQVAARTLTADGGKPSRGVVIVALPDDDDVIEYKDGSRARAHETLAYLGKVDTLHPEDRDAILAHTKRLAKRHGPFMANVSGYGTLGPEQDRVMLTEAPELQQLHDGCLAHDGIKKLYDEHSYPTWTSHITGLERPMNQPIRFSKLAAWIGEDRQEFDLEGAPGGDASVPVMLDDSMDDGIMEELEDERFTHAGLIIKALDSGRVLMTQRTPYHSDDPGTYGAWEFPGGSIDEGETAAEAAVREFTEETGLSLPAGWRVANTSLNDTYAGVVVVVPNEAWTTDAELLDRETMGIGWFDVRDVVNLGRPELADCDFDAVITAAAVRALTAATWDEEKHERDLRGRFAPKDEGEEARLKKEATRRADAEYKQQTRAERAIMDAQRRVEKRRAANARRDRGRKNSERRRLEQAQMRQEHQRTDSEREGRQLQEREQLEAKQDQERKALEQKHAESRQAREEARVASQKAAGDAYEAEMLLRDAEASGDPAAINNAVAKLKQAREKQKETLRAWVAIDAKGEPERERAEREALRDSQRAERDEFSARHRSEDESDRIKQRAEVDQLKLAHESEREMERDFDYNEREAERDADDTVRANRAREDAAFREQQEARRQSQFSIGDGKKEENHGRWVFQNGKWQHVY